MGTLTWHLHPQRLPLLRPLHTTQGIISERQVWLLEVSADGLSAWGEASPLPGFGGELPAHCVEQLASIPDQPREALSYAGTLDAHAPCAAAAIRGALADLHARKRGCPLAVHLAAALGQRPASRLSCTVLLPDADPERARSALAQGCSGLKWKSSGNWEEDAANAKALRSTVGPGLRLRLDVNGGWTIDDCLRFAEAVRDLDLDYVEQPLPRGQEGELAALTAHRLRVALDESVHTLADVERAVRECWAEVLVIKPQWMGGFPALRQALFIARSGHPRRVVVSSTLDSAVGRSHALHAAAALGLDSEVHGLATGNLLAHDVADEPVAGGHWQLPSSAGLGLEPRL